MLTAGRGLLLVDGIDEIPEPERERTRRWLRDLLGAFPGNLWLVTSRPSTVREDWLASDGFTELTLSSMGRDDVAAFIRRWHRAAGAEASYAEALVTAVRTKQDLGRLTTNPLMCGLVCALHRERGGYLPHGRKELYEAALSMLLEQRDRERDMVTADAIQLTTQAQIQLLQKLAYWMIRNGRLEMSPTDAVDLLSAALPAMPHVAALGTAEEIFRHLLVRSGLLREPAAGSVDFVHRTFQDFLGAKAAVEDRDFGLLVNNAHLDQWEDVIRMAVAHAGPDQSARLLTEILQRGAADEAHRHRLYLVAAASLEHATELDPAIRAAVEARTAGLLPPQSLDVAYRLSEIGPLVLELLPGPEGLTDEEARLVTVTASRIGTEAAIPVLARFRDHTDLDVRSQLIWSWGRFDTARYADEVVAHLAEEDLFFSVRNAAEAAVLARLGGRDRMMIATPEIEEIRPYLSPDRLTHLWLRHQPTTTLEWLASFPHLRELTCELGPPDDIVRTVPAHITVSFGGLTR